MRIEWRRQIAHIEDVLAEAADVLACVGAETDLSIRQIQVRIEGRDSRGIVGEIAKRARAPGLPSL